MSRITYKDLPIERDDKVQLTINLSVSVPQAYALIAMFNYWNICGKTGISREIGLETDGNFNPMCEIKMTPQLPKMPEEQLKQAIVWDDQGNRKYAYDPLDWSLQQ